VESGLGVLHLLNYKWDAVVAGEPQQKCQVDFGCSGIRVFLD
jgi:hypothetical protein